MKGQDELLAPRASFICLFHFIAYSFVDLFLFFAVAHVAGFVVHFWTPRFL